MDREKLPTKEDPSPSELHGALLLIAGIVCFIFPWIQTNPNTALPTPQWVTEMATFFQWPLIIFAVGVIRGGHMERKHLSK